VFPSLLLALSDKAYGPPIKNISAQLAAQHDLREILLFVVVSRQIISIFPLRPLRHCGEYHFLIGLSVL